MYGIAGSLIIVAFELNSQVAVELMVHKTFWLHRLCQLIIR